MTRVSEATQLGWAITAQRNWIRDHGSSAAGYVAYYATLFPGGAAYTHSEVEAIHAADHAYLAKLQGQV